MPFFLLYRDPKAEGQPRMSWRVGFLRILANLSILVMLYNIYVLYGIKLVLFWVEHSTWVSESKKTKSSFAAEDAYNLIKSRTACREDVGGADKYTLHPEARAHTSSSANASRYDYTQSKWIYQACTVSVIITSVIIVTKHWNPQ